MIKFGGFLSKTAVDVIIFGERKMSKKDNYFYAKKWEKGVFFHISGPKSLFYFVKISKNSENSWKWRKKGCFWAFWSWKGGPGIVFSPVFD